jgi:hypothetical protein
MPLTLGNTINQKSVIQIIQFKWQISHSYCTPMLYNKMNHTELTKKNLWYPYFVVVRGIASSIEHGLHAVYRISVHTSVPAIQA